MTEFGRIAIVLATLAMGACSKSNPGACGDGGTPHDDTVTVVRGSDDGPDFDECVAGQCLTLCVDERGNPGDGTRVHILTCDRISTDGGTQIADAAVSGDASQVSTPSLSLRIVYDVFTCTAD